jgi:hypothetical protein
MTRVPLTHREKRIEPFWIKIMTNFIRQPAVAGMFYPGDKTELHLSLKTYIQEAVQKQTEPQAVPKAIIVPHAGYIYSGPVAASAYARLLPAKDQIHRVVLLGPSHRVPFRGLASSSATHFVTPLGQIPLDRQLIEQLETFPQVTQLDQAHAQNTVWKSTFRSCRKSSATSPSCPWWWVIRSQRMWPKYWKPFGTGRKP